MKNVLFDLMVHKGIPYDSLLRMDVETFHELLEHLKELSTGQRRLTDSQRELVEMAKKERMGWQHKK